MSSLHSKKKRSIGYGGGGGSGSGSQDSASSDESSLSGSESSSSSASASGAAAGSTARSTLQLAKSLVDAAAAAPSSSNEATAGPENKAGEKEATATTVFSRDRRDNGSARQLAMLSADDNADDSGDGSGTYGAADGSRYASSAEAERNEDAAADDDDWSVLLAWSSRAEADRVDERSGGGVDDDGVEKGEMAVDNLQQDRGEAGNNVSTANREEELRQQQQDDMYMRMAVQMAESVYVLFGPFSCC